METDYKAYFSRIAESRPKTRQFQSGFHRQILGLLRHHIPEGSRVLEVGCALGDMIAGLKPSRGLGTDFTALRVQQAREKHPSQALEFRESDILEEAPDEQFDAILLDYLTGYLSDVQQVFETLQTCAHARTRLYITSLNYLWRPMLALGQIFGLVNPQPLSNWLSRHDLVNLLELAGWEVVASSSEQILPFQWPLLSGFFNRFLVRLPFFNHLGCTLFMVARPKRPPALEGEVSCTVVVPARNESGNIRAALERIPTLGRQTEVIFVEGNSKDDTWEVIQRECEAYVGPHLVSFCQQPGKGKWDAVFTGFERAQGDVLVVQDGDLTAPPEDLPKFYNAIASGNAEFANGSRLVYPMESKAMRFLNLLGNKFFAVTLSFIISQPIKDSLCGTKMILRSDYHRLMKRIEVFGDFDPFGDFNLLFGSALLDLKIRDIPVRYRDRTYGDTNIQRFHHGKILLDMSWFGLWRLRMHRLLPQDEGSPAVSEQR